MPSRSLVRAFLAIYGILGLVVLVQSVQTVLAAHHGNPGDHDREHALLLGGLETLAAVTFLVPRTMRIGGVALLAIFGLAFGLHAVQGHPNLTLLVYSAGVLFVLVHGVRGYNWRATARS